MADFWLTKLVVYMFLGKFERNKRKSEDNIMVHDDIPLLNQIHSIWMQPSSNKPEISFGARRSFHYSWIITKSVVYINEILYIWITLLSLWGTSKNNKSLSLSISCLLHIVIPLNQCEQPPHHHRHYRSSPHNGHRTPCSNRIWNEGLLPTVNTLSSWKLCAVHIVLYGLAATSVLLNIGLWRIENEKMALWQAYE